MVMQEEESGVLQGFLTITARFRAAVHDLGIDMWFSSLGEAQHFFGQPVVKGRVEVNRDVSLARDGGEGVPSAKSQKTPVKRGSRMGFMPCLPILLGMMCVVMPACEAYVDLKETAQHLRQECKDMLRFDLHGQCPDSKRTYQMDLSRLQELCCSSFGEINKFHCQLFEMSDGTDLLFVACLPEVTVLAGHHGLLTVDENNFPMIVQHPCAQGFYAPSNRSSTTEIYPFCRLPHTWCKTDRGETVFCMGDAFANTWCHCADGYSPTFPHCDHQAFDKHSGCTCQPNKTATYCRTELVYCSSLADGQFSVSSTCPQSVSPAPPHHPAPQSTNKPSGRTLPPSTPIHPTSELPEISDSAVASGLPPGVIAVIIILIILVVALAIFVFRKQVRQLLGHLVTLVRHPGEQDYVQPTLQDVHDQGCHSK